MGISRDGEAANEAAGAPEEEIDVTPEMIAAGVDVVFGITEDGAVRLYRAMEAVRQWSMVKEGRPG